MGPIALLDEVGIDVGAKVAKVMHDALRRADVAPASMEKVLADGRQGRKNKRGFYTYDGKEKRVDESVYALLPGGGRPPALDAREIQDRLVFAFLNEAVLCLQEGILRSPRDGDVGAIFGLGFPPFLGGPFRYLDHLGARFALEMLEKLAGPARGALPAGPDARRPGQGGPPLSWPDADQVPIERGDRRDRAQRKRPGSSQPPRPGCPGRTS